LQKSVVLIVVCYFGGLFIVMFNCWIKEQAIYRVLIDCLFG